MLVDIEHNLLRRPKLMCTKLYFFKFAEGDLLDFGVYKTSCFPIWLKLLKGV